jgi:predicted choloylglycine hydrolase
MKTSTRTSRKPGSIILVALVLLAILVAVLIMSRSTGHPVRQSTDEIELLKVDDHPLYVMHYTGDYGFDEFLEEGLHGGSGIEPHLAGTNDWACSCFAAMARTGDVRFGRNFDWNDDPALLLFTDPPDAYASVSMVDISYLGIGKEEPSREDRLRLAEAPFMPFDGMNEYGVAIGMMAVPHAEGGNDHGKVTIDSLHAIRLVLDYARNVDEAIDLLENYNIDFSGGPPLHYLIADAGGNSVVVEYLDGFMTVIPNNENWQVATNFILSDVMLDQAKSSCNRYQIAYDTLSKTAGQISLEKSMSLLQDVSQDNTIWSVVYNMTSGEIHVVMGRAYEHTLEFKLELIPIN